MKKSAKKPSKEKIILKSAVHFIARYGCHNLSMRDLAKTIPLSQSVFYYYYDNKDDLLKHAYEYANRELGEARLKLPPKNNVSEKFKQLINFQFEHAELIVAVLRYYLYKRDIFYEDNEGTLPEKATLHVEEVLEYGVQQKEIRIKNIKDQAKVIAHSINGYLLEYYPHMPQGKTAANLTNIMVEFFMKSLTNASQHKPNIVDKVFDNSINHVVGHRKK